MIASLSGKVTYKSPELKKDSYFVITCSGIGFKVYTVASNLRRLKEDEDNIVYTYLAVSENSMDLYGFLNPADKTFFTLLLDVPGIGPKSALGILEKTSMSEVQQAIMENNPELLTKVSGIGLKTAEKIVVALKDKVESLTVYHRQPGEPDRIDSDVFDALVGFGYPAALAKKVMSQIDQSKDTQSQIKEALKMLSKQL